GAFTVKGLEPAKVAYSYITPPKPSAPAQSTGGASISPRSGQLYTPEEQAVRREIEEGGRVKAALQHNANNLQSSFGASEVSLWGGGADSGGGSKPVVASPGYDIANEDPIDDVATAART